ncbi:MAG: hypothetical protein ACRESS_05275 [Stenotrophobium sp.]
MHFRSLKTAGSLLLAALAFGTQPASASTPRIGFWAGESVNACVGYDPLTCPRNVANYTPALWNLLKTNNSFLDMDLIYGSDFGPALPGANQRTDGLALVHQANAAGVSISAWITVPLSYGTFANQQNAATIQAAVLAFYTWKTQNNLQIDQAILDLEFPLGYQALAQAIQGNYAAAQNMASSNLNPAAQCTAMGIYRDTITWAHQHGMKLSGSPLPFSLSDVAAGNMAEQSLLGMVNYPPFGFDQLYNQAYRAEGVDLGSGYVASIYNSMRSYFGAAGQVSLGSTGTSPYNTVAPVVLDVQMLAGLGATIIPIFDLDGAMNSYGLNGIQQIFDAAHNPLTGSALTTATQLSFTGSQALAAYNDLQSFATGATPWVTGAQGQVQYPNTYPNGCGNMTAAPLP